MSETVPEYRVEQTIDGAIVSIRRSADDYAVPLDTDSPDYCAFVQWFASQPGPTPSVYAQLRAGMSFVCESSRPIVDYCKRDGLLLIAESGRLRLGGEALHLGSSGHFYRLSVARIPRPEEPSAGVSDGV